MDGMGRPRLLAGTSPMTTRPVEPSTSSTLVTRARRALAVNAPIIRRTTPPAARTTGSGRPATSAAKADAIASPAGPPGGISSPWPRPTKV
jgi:hypothetical protein